MKTHHSKLRNPPRPIFSCAFFRHCTQTTLSPTTPSSPVSHHPPPSLPPPPSLQPPTTTTRSTKPSSSSSSSSSSSTSQSFTQWKFPLPPSPIHPNPNPLPTPSVPPPPPLSSASLQEIFHLAELRLSSRSSEYDRLAALNLLEHSFLPNPPPDDPACPSELMRQVVSCMRSKLGAKPATKVLFALCLAGSNRQVAVEVGAVVETAMELDGSAAERALAALELMCTVADGASEIRSHALSVPVMVAMMAKMEGRGREHAIGVLAVVFGGGSGEIAIVAPPEEVARAVALALQGDCSVRGKRKGAQLLKVLQESSGNGRSDSAQEGG